MEQQLIKKQIVRGKYVYLSVDNRLIDELIGD